MLAAPRQARPSSLEDGSGWSGRRGSVERIQLPRLGANQVGRARSCGLTPVPGPGFEPGRVAPRDFKRLEALGDRSLPEGAAPAKPRENPPKRGVLGAMAGAIGLSPIQLHKEWGCPRSTLSAWRTSRGAPRSTRHAEIYSARPSARSSSSVIAHRNRSHCQPWRASAVPTDLDPATRKQPSRSTAGRAARDCTALVPFRPP